jgi:hypothetical protein
MDPGMYFFINQGCLTVDNMNDQDEMEVVEVISLPPSGIQQQKLMKHNYLANDRNS